MQLYHGTYLKDDTIITIPEELFNNGSFFKYTKLYVYGIIRKSSDTEYLESDDVQIFITPYLFEDLKYIYWFELSMPNVKGAFLACLKIFKEYDINILDCRGVDTIEDLIGKVDIIAYYKGDHFDDIMNNLDKAIKSIEPYFEDKFNKGSVVGRQSFVKQLIINLDDFYNKNDKKYPDRFVSDEFTLDQLKKWKKGKKEKNRSKYEEYEINIFSKPKWHGFIEITKSVNSRYLGITSFSEGNFIAVKFKSPEENVVPLRVEFKCNKEGLLHDIIHSLSSIGVNLKLISPQKLGTFPIVYNILFDIATTKLKGYNLIAMKKLIKSYIHNDDIEIGKIEDYPRSGTGNLKTKDIITESDNKFRNDIKADIKSYWIEPLKRCIGECKTYNNEECFLEKSSSQRDLKALLDKIENLEKRDFTDLKIALSGIRFNPDNKHCDIKEKMGNFYLEMEKYINNSITDSVINKVSSIPEDPNQNVEKPRVSVNIPYNK
jgi:hypothetical protein